MSGMERSILVSAIYDTGLDSELGFKVDTIHESYLDIKDVRGRWRVILIPNAGRIYFLSRIVALINTLDIDVGIHTDINYAGCIVIN